MKQVLLGTVLLVFFLANNPVAQSNNVEAWTGGFLMGDRWHAINVRVDRNAGTGTADFISPYFGGADNAINVGLINLKTDPANVRLEIPAARGSIVLRGKQAGDTITGDFTYDGGKGSFGLTRIWNTRLDILEQYYGAYRVAPGHVISILRGWGYARTLNYVDYKTGKVGTLWPSSSNEFFSGDGLAISFPVTTKARFVLQSDGRWDLVWEEKTGPKIGAVRIELKEERITFRNGDITLGGTLIIPPTKGPHPAIIVTPGDYGTNRNQLRLWAHHYASTGVSALIFDSRGAGDSTGPINSSSFSDLAGDVLAGIAALKARNEIDPKRIGLFGFSNSSFTVSLAASRSSDVAFLVLQSFVGVVPWKQETFRAETQLRVDGFSSSDVKKGADLMRMKYDVARTGVGWNELEKIVNRSRGERWLPYTSPPNSYDRLKSVYDTSMTYDPVAPLEKLRIPILALWGAEDTYLPVNETVMVFRKAMKKAGNKNFAVKIYPGTNHSLILSGDGSPSTGGTEKAFAPGLWETKREWLSKVIR